MFAVLKREKMPSKYKFSVELFDNYTKPLKTVKFGDSKYNDFTTHNDEKRKISYILRHAKNEDWNDPLTAGFWSRWLLWNLPNINDSMRFISDKFGIIFV